MTEPALLEVAWTDPVTGCRGYLVIDRLVRGVASGGLRMRRGCTLFEVRGLARGMTLKEGLNYDPDGRYVPLGGAKGGIDFVIAEIGLLSSVQAVYPLLEDRAAATERLADAFRIEVGGLGSTSWSAASASPRPRSPASKCSASAGRTASSSPSTASVSAPPRYSCPRRTSTPSRPASAETHSRKNDRSLSRTTHGPRRALLGKNDRSPSLPRERIRLPDS
jgi:hypothetical protein